MAKNTPSGSTAAGEPTKKPKKRRWYHNVADAYKLTAKIIPDTKFWVWGLFFGILALFIVLGIVTGRWIMLPILGLSLAVMAAMGALAFKANKARHQAAKMGRHQHCGTTPPNRTPGRPGVGGLGWAA